MKQTITRNSINYGSILLRSRLLLGIVFYLSFSIINSFGNSYDITQSALSYEIIAVFPHDNTAFTQGLVWHNGFLYEGTGLYGSSSLRKVKLETGKVLQYHSLSADYFGEGITIFQDRIYQLTWKEQTGFIYDVKTFQLIDTFSYCYEGWGITHDGKHLIISDGSPVLRFLDPYTLEEVKQITVNFHKVPVHFINELEYIKGKIFANIWQTDYLAIIEPESGEVTDWLNLEGILDNIEVDRQKIDVLNGIAYDEEKDRLFVTGKFWPNIFQIKIKENIIN